EEAPHPHPLSPTRGEGCHGSPAPGEGAEQLIRLDPCFCCYAAPPNTPAPSEIGPADRNSFVTFGAPHKLDKLNYAVLDLWARLLKQVPDARLLLARDTLSGSAQERLLSEFEKRGIDRARIVCRRLRSIPRFANS